MQSFIEILTESQKDSIAHALISQTFKKGEAIVKQGDDASAFYIIEKVKKSTDKIKVI